MKRYLLALIACLFLPAALANAPLPSEQAFVNTVEQQGAEELLVRWHMPEGYHLYKKHISFSVDKPKETQLDQPHWPPVSGHLPSPNGAPLAVYTGNLSLTIPYTSTRSFITLSVHYQGCASAGFCYPPTTRRFEIPREGPYYVTIQPSAENKAPIIQKNTDTHSHKGKPEQLLDHSHLIVLLAGFFVFGLLISLTPCVLPMIPILVSVLVNAKGKRLFSKAIAYVIGMAITYASVGAVVSLLGSSIQADLQQPWIIVTMAVLFVLMALALFDCFNVSLPSRITSAVSQWQVNSRYGVISALFMGIISSLILSPCITPPLLGALVYIGQSGNLLRGTLALFTMGLGMGIPLLIIAIFSQRFLPKAGNWMTHIKTGLAMLMFAVAIVTLSHITPNVIAQLLWIVWFLGLGTLLMRGKSWINILLAALVIAYAGWLGAQTYYLGANSTLPLPRTANQHKAIKTGKKITSLQSLEKALTQAPHNQLVMLRVTAEWCLACQLMDAHVFPAQSVQKTLSHVTQLTFDITKPKQKAQSLMKHYQLIAPPVLLFFRNGKEIPNSRLIGEQSVESLTKSIKSIS